MLGVALRLGPDRLDRAWTQRARWPWTAGAAAALSCASSRRPSPRPAPCRCTRWVPDCGEKAPRPGHRVPARLAGQAAGHLPAGARRDRPVRDRRRRHDTLLMLIGAATMIVRGDDGPGAARPEAAALLPRRQPGRLHGAGHRHRAPPSASPAACSTCSTTPSTSPACSCAPARSSGRPARPTWTGSAAWRTAHADDLRAPSWWPPWPSPASRR